MILANKFIMIMADYAQITQGWHQLSNGLPYKWIVDFMSYRGSATYQLSNEDWEKRDYIVNFKGNSELTTEIDHQAALQKAIHDVSTLITSSFGDKTGSLTLVCVPAATIENTERRFKTFSEEVCKECQMENGYGHWEEADFLKGKDIILFDDIIASGKSIASYADQLTSLGANVVAAIALGKTV